MSEHPLWRAMKLVKAANRARAPGRIIAMLERRVRDEVAKAREEVKP